jgi:hypothetical protein
VIGQREDRSAVNSSEGLQQFVGKGQSQYDTAWGRFYRLKSEQAGEW